MSSERTGAGQSTRLVDEQGAVMCERCEVARRMLQRMRGLMGRKSLEPGSGMLITHSGSIHTFFMHFPIDAVFLDKNMRVRKIVREMPRRRTASSFGARSVLELPAGEAARVGLEVGARLSWHHPEP
ncbi:MAG TPA: DUF192 domain-containing protein [Gaiellaceae bacterium]